MKRLAILAVVLTACSPGGVARTAKALEAAEATKAAKTARPIEAAKAEPEAVGRVTFHLASAAKEATLKKNDRDRRQKERGASVEPFIVHISTKPSSTPVQSGAAR